MVKNPIDKVRAKLQVQRHHLENVKMFGDDFSINSAIEMLENAEHEAMNLLDSMGYHVHINNLYKIIEIAYKSELKASRFNCTYLDLYLFSIMDKSDHSAIVRREEAIYLAVTLPTVKGHEVFTIKGN